jgi:soluble lytic murein transglycosylase-like protein
LDRCFLEAGTRYKINPNLLKAIAIVESGVNPKAVSKKGSIGLMQVHRSWIFLLKEKGVDVKHLMDSCYNIMLGAYILRTHINEVGGDLWKGVGRYNAKSKKKHLQYVKKVKFALQMLENKLPKKKIFFTLSEHLKKCFDN